MMSLRNPGDKKATALERSIAIPCLTALHYTFVTKEPDKQTLTERTGKGKMVTRAARAAVTKRTAATLGRKASPGKLRSEQKEGRSREDAYDEDSVSSSSLSSLSSQSEFELSEEDESTTVSRYFQRPAMRAEPEIKKRKKATAVAKGVGKKYTEREPRPSLGDIAPAITKQEGKKKGKGVIKTEPPAHWEKMYDAVKEMRSRIPAPVDTMGCERLADGASTPKVCFSRTIRARYSILT